MTSGSITRRIFLRTLVCLSAFGLRRPARALAGLATSSGPDLLAANLARIFVHKNSAAIVGIEYLRCVPGERDVRLLVELICSSRAERRVEFTQADAGKLRELLLLQQRQDFAHGRTVKIQGWVLSKTEARLCALTALI